MQIGLNESNLTMISAGGYLILDFGKEISGGVRILTYKAKTVPVRIRFGESLTECCAELGGKQNATNDHALRDFETLLPKFSDMTFSESGFRFLRAAQPHRRGDRRPQMRRFRGGDQLHRACL